MAVRNKAPVRAGLGTAPLVVPRTLPRGINSLPPEVVLLSQQSRIVEGMAHVVAEKGYAATSVADIIAYAGVSRTTFYALYADKESCFLACFESLAKSHLDAVEQALALPAPPPERLIAALAAYLERIDADRWFARAFIGEAESATPAIRQAFLHAAGRLQASIEGWVEDVRRDHAEVPRPGQVTIDLLHAALAGYVVGCVRRGEPLMPKLPEIAVFVFAALGLAGWAGHVRNPAAS